jgi:hypothetical protein
MEWKTSASRRELLAFASYRVSAWSWSWSRPGDIAGARVGHRDARIGSRQRGRGDRKDPPLGVAYATYRDRNVNPSLIMHLKLIVEVCALPKAVPQSKETSTACCPCPTGSTGPRGLET